MNTRNTIRDNINNSYGFNDNNCMNENKRRKLDKQKIIITNNNNNSINDSNKTTEINVEIDVNNKSIESVDTVIDKSNNDWSEEKNPKDSKPVFVCKWKLCWFRTSSESLIRKHTIQHSKPYKCSFVGCGERFVETKELLSHFSGRHLGPKAFHCTFPECQLNFSDIKSLTEHRITHVSKRVKSSKTSHDNQSINDYCNINTQSGTECQKRSIALKGVSIEEKLKKENRSSVRLSDCIDYENNCNYFQINDNQINVGFESQNQISQKLTTCIERAEIEPQKDESFKANESEKSHKTSVSSVIRCTKVTDEIVEGNDNYVKLRSTEGKFWYKCLWDYCDYGNINEGMIRKHVQKHEFPHKCSFNSCNKCFATLSEMAEHRQLTHSGINPYICDWPQCEDAFQSLQLLSEHKRQHLVQTISCSENKVKKIRIRVESKHFQCSFGRCNMHYSTKEELEVHQQIHSGDRPFKCLYPECTFAAKTNDKLRIHHSRHSANKSFKCLWPTCGKSFRISEQLRRHRKLHTNSKELSCEFVDCELVFETSVQLEAHLRLHLGLGKTELPFDVFKCDFGLCKMQFQTKEELQTHIRIHRGNRLHKCNFDKCSYSAKTLDKLTAHIRYHSGERPFKCDFIGCHQEFTQSHHLVRHRKSHFGSKDSNTDNICLESYSSKESLKSHNYKKQSKRRQSADSGPVFSANDLDFDFNPIVVTVKRKAKKKPIKKKASKINDKSIKNWTKNDEMKESSNNKQFSCTFGKCNFRCLTQTELSKHNELHSGDRPLQCAYYGCTFRTKRKDKLTIHTRRHTGERPYVCDWNDCTQAFVTRTHLNRHQLTHGKSKLTLSELQKLDDDINQTLLELDQLIEENMSDS